MDPRFRVEVLAQTANPQRLIWWAMHQDYSEGFVFDENPPSEEEAGRIAVKRLLSGERGHYGPLEHPQITFNCGWFPHSVMQQGRTHRISSWDVQSGRYTGLRVINALSSPERLEDVFYLRPVGTYTDRQGKRYDYTAEHRDADLDICYESALRYAHLIDQGCSEEHARGILPFDIRQHFVVSFSLRALLHFLDLRAKADAQQEIRQLCELMWPHVKAWAPEIASWYEVHRWGRARLAP